MILSLKHPQTNQAAKREKMKNFVQFLNSCRHFGLLLFLQHELAKIPFFIINKYILLISNI